MKYTKKVVSLILAILISFSAVAMSTVSASAETDANFPALDSSKANLVIDKVSTKSTGTVTIPIKINNNPGLWGVNFQIAYNEGLTFDRDATISATTGKSVFDGTILFTELNNNVVTIYAENTDLTDTTKDGVVVNLVFKLTNVEVNKTYNVGFTYVDRKNFINSKPEEVSMTFGNGGVEIKEIINISDSDFKFDLADKIFTGSEIKPQVTSDVIDEQNYEVKYSDNINAGTATITVAGLGNYEGKILKTFNIFPKTLAQSDFQNLISQEYLGIAIEPKVTALNKLITANDFEVLYSNNENVGIATAKITGKNNFKGIVELSFEITSKELIKEYFEVNTDNKIYTGNEITTTIESGFKDTDYTVQYQNNKNVGTATIILTGKDNATGSLEYTFEIVAKPIANEDFTVDTANKIYTGKSIEPEVKSSLVKNIDYTVSYSKNINAGTGTVIIKGKGNYAGEITKSYQIIAKPITLSMFKIDTSNVTYTGKTITKKVTASGITYTVSYKDNKNVGKATIIIKGTGNYSGTVVKTFNILKPVKPNKPAKLTVKSTGKKMLSVTWKTVTGADGYIITVSLNSKFSSAKKYKTKSYTITNSKTSKKILASLASGKKYYVKITAYKNYQQTGKKGIQKVIGGVKTITKAIKVK